MGTNAGRYARQAAGAAIARQRVGAAAALGYARDAAREAARLASYTAPTLVLTAQDAGSTAKVVIAAHTRIYPLQGTINVPDVAIAAAEVTGLAFATDYFIYYDDPTLEVTAPAFVATEDAVEAAIGSAPGRHFVGVVTTPADGGTATTGTGGTAPPGGGGGRYLDNSTL